MKMRCVDRNRSSGSWRGPSLKGRLIRQLETALTPKCFGLGEHLHAGQNRSMQVAIKPEAA